MIRAPRDTLCFRLDTGVHSCSSPFEKVDLALFHFLQSELTEYHQSTKSVASACSAEDCRMYRLESFAALWFSGDISIWTSQRMAFTSVCENTVNRRLDRREQTSDGLTNRRTCFESHLSFSVSIPAYRSKDRKSVV